MNLAGAFDMNKVLCLETQESSWTGNSAEMFPISFLMNVKVNMGVCGEVGGAHTQYESKTADPSLWQWTLDQMWKLCVLCVWMLVCAHNITSIMNIV